MTPEDHWLANPIQMLLSSVDVVLGAQAELLQFALLAFGNQFLDPTRRDIAIRANDHTDFGDSNLGRRSGIDLLDQERLDIDDTLNIVS